MNACLSADVIPYAPFFNSYLSFGFSASQASVAQCTGRPARNKQQHLQPFFGTKALRMMGSAAARDSYAPISGTANYVQEQRKFKTIAAVEEWDRQYLKMLHRYKFLVLDGRSRTGKSRFAAERTTPERFLNVDCSSATEPDMRLFDRKLHDVVLWDEATPELVLRVKKLAQASIDEVRLGQSATNVNAYVVWFHRVKLIVATNVWAANLERCTQEDREWLTANSVYVLVESPLHL